MTNEPNKPSPSERVVTEVAHVAQHLFRGVEEEIAPGVKGVWHLVPVKDDRDFPVLATDEETAIRIAKLFTRKSSVGKVSLLKSHPGPGRSSLRQVPFIAPTESQLKLMADKDIDEMKRRDGVDYCYAG